ncbi:hypothetical protein BCY91_00460 [Pelobium manganitolerans]|uniref:Peptidyl-prolyl cis-trans isomerase n=1 Tax=Pelobium manganitolerans TaxID=1842495 RepID=A0A419SBD4_9SPHI|nr:FKBP-type peptidyl-prolyl cis-trans isomerase [Pelobium manganitolerans]RKD20132.1 hypothetical protein BCY91_00460 [Pelobium manganitolerans]
MRLKNYLYLAVALLLGFSACKKDEPIDRNALAYAQYGKDTLIIQKFLEDNNIEAKKDSVYDVYYQIIEPGTGDVNFTPTTNITVNYKGRLLNGSVFDQGTEKMFQLGYLIAGWQMGIPRIQKGGKIRLIVPSGFAYGDVARPGIPANSILDFDIELTEIKN